MVNVPTWNIHTADGKYLGQTTSIHPKIALCRYLMITGREPFLDRMTHENLADGSSSLNYNGDIFVMTQLG